MIKNHQQNESVRTIAELLQFQDEEQIGTKSEIFSHWLAFKWLWWIQLGSQGYHLQLYVNSVKYKTYIPSKMHCSMGILLLNIKSLPQEGTHSVNLITQIQEGHRLKGVT